MNTTNNNNTAAPSVTIAPRNVGSPQGPRGALKFVVTLTTFQDVRSYPWLDRAIKIVDRLVREGNGKRKGKGLEETLAA